MQSNASMEYQNIPQYDLTDLDEILFNLICQGKTKLANKFLNNYLQFADLNENLGDNEL